MPRRATTERKQLRIPDLTIESCGIQVNIAILTCAMCAWVRTIALRLALGSHGYYLYLRAGFDRFSRFLLSLKLSFAGRELPTLRELPCTNAKHWRAAQL